MRAVGLGHAVFAAGLAGLGVLSLLSGDFALNWQPVPAWIPWRAHLAGASGAVLLAGGIGMVLKRTAQLSAIVVTAYVFLWLVLLHAPRVIMTPTTELVWLGFAETVTLVAGGCILAASLTRGTPRFAAKPFANARTVCLARLVYAAALPVIGLSHFVYVQGTTSLVPAWLPYRTALAYGTGAAQIAAGLGLLVGVLPRAAALLEALLISSFTVLVWGPRVVADSGNRLPWTAFFVSTAIAGAAWAVAESFDGARGDLDELTPSAPTRRTGASIPRPARPRSARDFSLASRAHRGPVALALHACVYRIDGHSAAAVPAAASRSTRHRRASCGAYSHGISAPRRLLGCGASDALRSTHVRRDTEHAGSSRDPTHVTVGRSRARRGWPRR